MAHGFRYGHDPDSGPLHHHPGLPPQRPYDPCHLHVSIALEEIYENTVANHLDANSRAIVPIGIMFSLSLICGNLAYMYLSVSFIQMLKATNAVVTLLATWAFGIAPANYKTLGNVGIIVVGVVIASFGEIKFDMIGFLIQVGGIIFEALRLVMVQRLLSSAEFKMDPLVSLYYYAPACALTNGVVTLFTDLPRMTMADIYGLGVMTLIANALVAFLLNASVVLLVRSNPRFN